MQKETPRGYAAESERRMQLWQGQAILTAKHDQGKACIEEFVRNANDATLAAVMDELARLSNSTHDLEAAVGKLAAYGFTTALIKTRRLGR